MVSTATKDASTVVIPQMQVTVTAMVVGSIDHVFVIASSLYNPIIP
jgi:hypothetical protein